MEKQKENSLGNITWSEMGKQNVQAKEVQWTFTQRCRYENSLASGHGEISLKGIKDIKFIITIIETTLSNHSSRQRQANELIRDETNYNYLGLETRKSLRITVGFASDSLEKGGQISLTYH